eukprot:615124_1
MTRSFQWFTFTLLLFDICAAFVMSGKLDGVQIFVVFLSAFMSIYSMWVAFTMATFIDVHSLWDYSDNNRFQQHDRSVHNTKKKDSLPDGKKQEIRDNPLFTGIEPPLSQSPQSINQDLRKKRVMRPPEVEAYDINSQVVPSDTTLR